MLEEYLNGTRKLQSDEEIDAKKAELPDLLKAAIASERESRENVAKAVDTLKRLNIEGMQV